MTKKAYQKPAMEVIEATQEQQLLAGSVTSVSTFGLDDIDLIIEEYEKTGDSWNDAQ